MPIPINVDGSSALQIAQSLSNLGAVELEAAIHLLKRRYPSIEWSDVLQLGAAVLPSVQSQETFKLTSAAGGSLNGTVFAAPGVGFRHIILGVMWDITVGAAAQAGMALDIATGAGNRVIFEAQTASLAGDSKHLLIPGPMFGDPNGNITIAGNVAGANTTQAIYVTAFIAPVS